MTDVNSTSVRSTGLFKCDSSQVFASRDVRDIPSGRKSPRSGASVKLARLRLNDRPELRMLAQRDVDADGDVICHRVHDVDDFLYVWHESTTQYIARKRASHLWEINCI